MNFSGHLNGAPYYLTGYLTLQCTVRARHGTRKMSPVLMRPLQRDTSAKSHPMLRMLCNMGLLSMLRDHVGMMLESWTSVLDVTPFEFHFRVGEPQRDQACVDIKGTFEYRTRTVIFSLAGFPVGVSLPIFSIALSDHVLVGDMKTGRTSCLWSVGYGPRTPSASSPGTHGVPHNLQHAVSALEKRSLVVLELHGEVAWQ